MSSSLSAVIDPVRLFTRPFCAPLFSTDILRAARAAPLVAVDGTHESDAILIATFSLRTSVRERSRGYLESRIDCYFDECFGGREACSWNE